MKHVRGAPYHPQTQGKIERWHRPSRTASCSKTTSYPVTSKPRSRRSSSNIIITATTKSLSNVAPADAYFGRGKVIIAKHARIKRITIEHRSLQHRKLAA